MRSYAKRLRTLASTGDENFTEVMKHAFWTLIVLGGATALQFVFDLFLARSFNAHGAGIFYLGLSVLMALALLGRLGLDRAVVRYIPPLFAKRDMNAVHGVSGSAVRLVLMVTVPLTGLLLFLAPVLANDVFNDPSITPFLRTFAFAIPPFALMYVYGGILRAIKHPSEAITIERVTIYAFGIIAIATLGALYGLEGTVIGFVLASYLAAGLGFWLIKRHIPKVKAITPFSKKRLMITAAPLLFVVFATQMNGQASVLILGASADSASVGIFNIALKVSMLMTLILTALNAIAATKISELHGSGKKEQLETLISKVSALGAVVATPLFLFIALFPGFLLGLFGTEFVAGADALVIMAAGQLINISVGTTVFILAMTGHERVLAGAVSFSLAANVALGLVLIPAFGVIGAGITTAFTIVLVNITMVLLVKRYLGVWTLPFRFINLWFRRLTQNP